MDRLPLPAWRLDRLRKQYFAEAKNVFIDCETSPDGGDPLPGQDLKKLLERIHLRLDESFVGIGEIVSDLAAADLAELINQLTLAEAASVISMLPVPRAVEVCNH